MKIKRGNLLTVLLAMLCAVALALGIGFLLPKAEKVNANAQTLTNIGSPDLAAGTLISNVGSFVNCTWANYPNTSDAIGLMETGDTFVCASADQTFNIKITVPAYTQYKVKYWLEEIAYASGTPPYTAGTQQVDRYEDGTYTSFKQTYGQVTWSFGGGGNSYFNTRFSVDNLIFTNDTGSQQDFYTYFKFTSTVTNKTGSIRTCFGVGFGPHLTEVEITELPIPNTTDTLTFNYDGDPHTVNFTYADALPLTDADGNPVSYNTGYENVTVTAEAKNYLGNIINASDYNFSASAGSGSLAAVNAGTYKIKFNLKPATISNNITWNDGTTTEKVITLVINRIGLTVPTVQNTTQTYDSTKNGCFFGVTGYDSNSMNALTVPATSADISWKVASTRFEATKVGTYTVEFELQDKDNYYWNVGTNGTTNNQPATLKVEPKKLPVPSVTASQEYTGSALTFKLSGFNNGAEICMDGVTAANGSTVTGASGAAINDTTDTFEAIKVGIYTVSLSLRNSTNYAWSDGTTLPKDIDFEITQKELISTAIVSDKTNKIGGAEWEFGDTATITITDDRISDENINLLLYYDNNSNTLSGMSTGNTTVITMPTNIAAGDHTLYVVLNGTTGDNANYKITKNNTLNFKITSGKLDPSTYGWTYTKDGVAGSTIANGGKVPFELKTGSPVDGVKYELSIQIPSTDTFVIVDTTKYTAGYLTRSGNSVNTFKTVVALKSNDPNNLFEVNGNMQDTCEVELNWEIEKGTFDLTNVKWEYSLNGTSGWTEYNSAKPSQYNDGYDITVRVKASTLPTGLTLDSLYTGMKESAVGNYTATISASDFKYNTNNFNAPNTGASTLTLNWDIVQKNIYNGFKNVSEPYANDSYSGNMIIKQLDLDSKYAGYIDYVYYDLDNGGVIVTLQDIKDAVDLTNPHNYKVEANIKTAYAANYEVNDNGNTPSARFTTGSNNKLADAAIDSATAVYDGNTHFGITHVTVTGSDSMNVTDFTVKYYKGTTPVAANELPAGELPKDAGDYCIEVILGTMAESKYILVTDRLTVTIEAKGIAVPTLDEMTFNGNEQKFEDYISGASWTTYGPAGMNIIKVDGKISDRNVGAGNYTTTLEITDTNYKWIDPATASTTKAVVKYSLAADEVKPTVNGDCTVATYNWNITPLIVDTTNMWNKGSKGATLNLPQNIKDLIAGGTLEVGYRYYDSDGVFVENPELKSGRSFKVEAVFTGDDSARNVQFKRSNTEFGAVSKDIDYIVPKSGAAVFFGKVKDALSQTWMGLPIWAWLLIALALIILLIIIIIVAKKRRKTKEEREAKKAAKEEEKQRREEERRLQREKLEAEREIARAKQEAELEKIRMQAQAGMAGAGMASMAMAAQQPAAQQPVQQQVVDNTNNELIKEMREQMAEMRAENRAAREQLRSMQYQQASMPQAMPQPMYQPQPVQAAAPAAGSDLMTLMDLKVQMAEMKSAQALAELKTAQAIAEAKGANKQSDNDRQYSQNYPNYGGYPSVNMGYGMQSIPAPQAVMTPYGILPAPQQVMTPYGVMPAYGYPPVAMLPQTAAYAPAQPKKEEEEPVVTATSQTTPSMTMSQPPYCPPGAVMTTTTTIDTSKSMENKTAESSNSVKSSDLRRTAADSADDITFDVDGFYDPLD